MPVPAPDAPTFDLQAHSVASDGELEPGEVVRRAAQAGVELLALSDHDTVEGVEEALRAEPRMLEFARRYLDAGHGAALAPIVQVRLHPR